MRKRKLISESRLSDRCENVYRPEFYQYTWEQIDGELWLNPTQDEHTTYVLFCTVGEWLRDDE